MRHITFQINLSAGDRSGAIGQPEDYRIRTDLWRLRRSVLLDYPGTGRLRSSRATTYEQRTCQKEQREALK